MGTANVCGAGWVVPAKYYEQTGQAGFLQKPIGAGPYKLVSQQQGVKLEFEAFADYYRPVHVKQLTMVSVPEAATRVAMLERGEADIMYFVPGELIDRVKNNPKLRLAPVVSGNWWLEFPGFQNPSNPFHDKRVREAISLAVDRDAINDAECGGMGVVDGNWINNDVEYGLEWPKWPHDVAKAKQLMAEAGYPNGFTVDWVTPAPNYYSRGERIVSQLQAIGIRSRLQVMERGVFLKKMQGGMQEWPGVQIIFNATRIGGTWSNWYDTMFRCGGFNSKDFFCVKDLDDQFSKYLASYDRTNASSWRSRSSGRSWRTTTSCRCSAMPSSTRSGRASRRRNGRTCFRRSPPATPIRGRTSSSHREGRRWVSSSSGGRCMPLPRCPS